MLEHLTGENVNEALSGNLLEEFHSGRSAICAFAAGIPTARVVRLPNADHYVYRSNEADVIREMNAFLTALR